MSYTAPTGDQVALPLAYAYTPPVGDAVALPMPDGRVEIIGNARFGDTLPAALVVAYGLDGVEIDRFAPDPASEPVGAYTIVSERGPLLLVAHRFDPQDWAGVWKPSTAYTVGQVVFSIGLGTDSESLVLQCAVDGTTDVAEPSWSEQIGTNTPDGTVSWTTLGRIRDVAPVTNYHIAE